MVDTATKTVTAEDQLRRRLNGITNLPSPPLIFEQMSRIINSPKTSVKDVAALMSEDAAMSAKVLRLSNSAFYGARNEITNIRKAVLILGLEAIKSLVLSSSVFDMFKSHKVDTEFQEEFWRHSLATALAARLLAKHSPMLKGIDPEIAFSGGLLHDIGKLIICCFMPEDHKQIVQISRNDLISDYLAEEKVLGFSHNLVGRVLAENWKLPGPIRAAIEHHHNPPLNEEGHYSSLVHVASYLARKSFEPRFSKMVDWTYLRPDVQAYLDMTDDVIEAFCRQLQDEYARSSTFMQMAMAD